MSPVLDPPEKTPRAKHQSPFAWRFMISTIRFVVIVSIAAVLGGTWYFAKKGFGEKTRKVVTEELRKHGVEARIGHLVLNPFRGLIAQDVQIFDYKNRENTLARISEVLLDINYGALLHHQPFLNAVDVRNAQLILPISRENERTERPQLTHFHAHVDFPPEQIYVSQAEGLFCGIRISATGQLIKRADYKPSPPLTDEEWQQRLAILRRVVSELQALRFPAEHPSLQIKFNGDIAEMENARVTVALRGERIRRDNYELQDLLVTAEYGDGRLSLNQLEWKDAGGNITGRAGWNRLTNDVDFQIRSSIDLKSLLACVGLGEPLADATFDTNPVITVSGTGKLENTTPHLNLIGHADIGRFTYHGVALSDFGTDFSWNGERTLLHDVHVRQQDGQLKADLLDAPNDFRLKVDGTMNPTIIRTFLSREMQQFLGEWQFQKPPEIHLEIHGPSRDAKTWQGDGTLELDRTRFRGVWMNRASSKLHFGDGAVTYQDFRVNRDEGVGSGNFTYDFKNHEVRISNVKAQLFPAEAIVWVDRDLVKTVTPYKFKQPPFVTVNGVYQMGGGKNTRIDIFVDASRGMEYVFLGKTLPLDRVSAKLIFTNDRLQINDLTGNILSGTVKGGADISLAHNDPHYKAKIAVEQIDFPRLTDLYFNYKTAHGQLRGNYDFAGLGSDARTMKGSGRLEVTNGDVFAIPVFGPLSGILNGVLPGSGYSIARKAGASFTIKDGIMHTDNFDASGKLFSLLGHGDIHFLDDKLDFDVRMDMHGAAGLLLTPMYKLFEYVGEGSLKKPDWHAKRF